MKSVLVSSITMPPKFSTSVELETDNVRLCVCASVTKLWGMTKSC